MIYSKVCYLLRAIDDDVSFVFWCCCSHLFKMLFLKIKMNKNEVGRTRYVGCSCIFDYLTFLKKIKLMIF